MSTCKFCGNGDVIGLRKLQSPHSEVSYTLYECKKCRQRFFMLEEHEISRSILKKLYDSQAKQNRNVYTAEFVPGRYWAGEVERISGINGKVNSVLDIGCRTGDFLMHWGNGVERVGVETAELSADIAEARGLHIIRDFVENVSFEHDFDVISCYALLEHLEKPKQIIDKIKSVCAKNGVVVILVPAFDTWKQRYIWQHREKQWHMYSPPEHLNFFTQEWLTEYMSDSFELVDYRYTSGGMVNPVRNIPVLSGIWSRIFWYLDNASYVYHMKIFDHLYMYFRKIR